jgi:RNA polymerase sigma-70 factor, ECF subfamily
VREDAYAEACHHIAAMKRYAVALCRDPVRADDLVQEALARALAAMPGFRRGAPMLPWLLRILHNVHVDDRRSRSHDVLPLEGWEDALAENPVAEQSVESSQLLRLLWTLPEDQRAAVGLVCLDELTYVEAAEVLGIPPGTLMSRLARGRAALRALAEGEEAPRRPARLRLVKGARS